MMDFFRTIFKPDKQPLSHAEWIAQANMLSSQSLIELPTEIRDMVLDYVFEDSRVVYSIDSESDETLSRSTHRSMQMFNLHRPSPSNTTLSWLKDRSDEFEHKLHLSIHGYVGANLVWRQVHQDISTPVAFHEYLIRLELVNLSCWHLLDHMPRFPQVKELTISGIEKVYTPLIMSSSSTHTAVMSRLQAFHPQSRISRDLCKTTAFIKLGEKSNFDLDRLFPRLVLAKLEFNVEVPCYFHDNSAIGLRLSEGRLTDVERWTRRFLAVIDRTHEKTCRHCASGACGRHPRGRPPFTFFAEGPWTDIARNSDVERNTDADDQQRRTHSPLARRIQAASRIAGDYLVVVYCALLLLPLISLVAAIWLLRTTASMGVFFKSTFGEQTQFWATRLKAQ